MKAILVIDVPDDYIGSMIDVVLYGKGKTVHEKYVNQLKPMPERLPEISGNIRYFGWNDCLEEIEK